MANIVNNLTKSYAEFGALARAATYAYADGAAAWA
jgi:hypothetical protein